MSSPGWTKRPTAAGRVDPKFSTTEHVSGWKIHHCGHPTSNWPYYLEAPDRNETIVSFNGRGFRSVEICKEIVTKILAGTFRISTEHCCPNIAIVYNVTAFGEFIGRDGRPRKLVPGEVAL